MNFLDLEYITIFPKIVIIDEPFIQAFLETMQNAPRGSGRVDLASGKVFKQLLNYPSKAEWIKHSI